MEDEFDRDFTVVRRALRAEDDASPLSALIAVKRVSAGLDDALRTLVRNARAAGHTWAEVGTIMGISRQAAQQRFGGTAETAVPEANDEIVGRTHEILDQLTAHQWARSRTHYDANLRGALPVAKIKQVWTQVERAGGPLDTVSAPRIVARGPFRRVELLLGFRYGPMRLLVSFDREHLVSGLFVVVPDDSGDDSAGATR